MNQFQSLSKFINPTDGEECVHRWIEQRRHVPEAHAPSVLDVDLRRLSVVQDPPYYFHRLVYEDSKEEAVFRMQGMLVSASLPPFQPRRPELMNLNHIRYTYQHAGIIGFQGANFTSQVQKIRELHLHFHRSSSRISMKAFRPSKVAEYVELVCKTRLFTTGNDAASCIPAPIPPLVDPNGIMQKLRQRKDIEFSDENLVAYRQLEVDEEDGTRSYNSIRPDAFQSGDIVELEFTLIAIPQASEDGSADKVYLLVLVLRGMTRLNERLSKEADMKELEGISSRESSPAPTRTTKRKIGYDKEDNDTSEARKRVAGMNLRTMVVDSAGG